MTAIWVAINRRQIPTPTAYNVHMEMEESKDRSSLRFMMSSRKTLAADRIRMGRCHFQPGASFPAALETAVSIRIILLFSSMTQPFFIFSRYI